MKYILSLFLILGLVGCTNKDSGSVLNHQELVYQGSGHFGEVEYGKSALQSFVIKNDTGSTVNLSPQVSNSDFSIGLNLGCGSVLPGKNCLVKVLFTTTDKVAGSYSANLTVGDLTIPLSASILTVPSVVYEFSINNQVIDGSLDLGELSGVSLKLLSVKVKNISPKIGNSSSLAVSNARFNILAGNCVNVVLKPGQSCTAKVSIKGDNTTDLLSNNFLFDSGVGAVSAQQNNVVYEGEMLSVSSSVVLGDFYQEGKLKIQNLMIKNLGNSVGGISDLSLPPGYTLLYNNCTGVRPGNSCIIKIAYQDEVGGNKGQQVDSVTVGAGNVDLVVNQVSKPNSLGSLTVTVNSDIQIETCSSVVVEVKDDQNLDYVSSSSLSLTSSLPLYQDSNCLEGATLSLDPFTSSGQFYIKQASSGPQTLVVNAGAVQGQAEIYFYSLLSISPENPIITISGGQNFSGVGGKPPYTYELVSGIGDLSGNLFTSNVSGSAVIKVKDSLNQESQTVITVNSNLVLSAGNCSYNVPESMTCQVTSSGGIGNKTYTTDQGEINPTSGVFKGQCVDNIGSAQVTVTDEYNNSDNITLTYPCVYVSCNQIKAESYGLTSAVYWIDLDGLNFGSDPKQVYCDQEQSQGGWALVAKYGDTSASSYHWFRGVTNTLELNNSFSSTMQISNLANSLVTRSSEVKVNYNSTWNSYFTINNLTADKNRLWGGTAANVQLGTIGVRPTSGFAAANYNSGQVVRMHYGTYGGALGSGFTSGVGSNQTLDVIAGCASYCAYRLPGIGSTPGGQWPIQNNLLQAYVKEAYYKHARTCQDAQTRGIKNQDGNLGSGIYTVDPDGANMGMDPFNVYCDQETDGGGWTLVSYAGPFSGSKSTVTGSATAFMPLFHVYGTINANPFVTKPSFSRFDLFKSMATGSSRFMAKRTSVPAKMISWSLVSPSYWGGTNSTLPAGTQTALRMTNSGNGGWQNKTNAFFTTASSGDSGYPGISWNTALYENNDGTGSFTTSLSRRSILYWASVNSDPVSYGPQWFHASPLSLAPSTGASNTVMDVEFYFRELP